MSGEWDGTNFREQVQGALDEFVAEQADRLEPLGSDAERLMLAAYAAVRGGKRFRAAFGWWGFRACTPLGSQVDESALIKACAALELLHASALVHDDYMDDSDTRRGHPATHRAFETEHRGDGWRGDPAQYGAAAAILLGDLLLGWADELLRRSGMAWETLAPAMRVFDACRTEVISGQFLDMSVQARGAADVDAAMTVLRYKSAKYSIERPLHLGATLAGASEEQVETLRRFGLPLGEAFQLRDDLLGVFGDPDVTGKPAGDDLIEGKRTVLVALTLDAAEPDAAAQLDQMLGTELSTEQVQTLRGIIENSGARADVEGVIGHLTRTALEHLNEGEFSPEATTVLTELARAATERTI